MSRSLITVAVTLAGFVFNTIIAETKASVESKSAAGINSVAALEFGVPLL